MFDQHDVHFPAAIAEAALPGSETHPPIPNAVLTTNRVGRSATRGASTGAS
jgi:hypothetical protein